MASNDVIFLACVAVALKPDTFEGMRFDFTKMISQHFALSHRCPTRTSSLPFFLSVLGTTSCLAMLSQLLGCAFH